jgi:hypothetical protein
MNAPTMTSAEKRTASRRANKAKQEAFRARVEEEQASAAAHPQLKTARDEASILQMMGSLQIMLAECRADMAKAARQDRKQMATQPVVALADWRRASA